MSQHNEALSFPIDDVGTTTTKVGRLELVWFDEIDAVVDLATIVDGLLTSTGMSCVYGESNCGKTFFATDLGMHIATGWRWRDRDVERGGVIYVAAEGGHGIKNRVIAFKQHHGIAFSVPFAVVPCPVDLCDPDADTEDLIALVRLASKRIDVPVRLVVIDTLARAMAGGNENAPDDMGAFVMNVDRVRQETQAHVLIVHHSGKDTAKGARGHSSLRAALDTEIEIKRDTATGIAVASVVKQRDMETDGEFAFSLAAVEIGTTAKGKPVTSCVVQPEDDAPRADTGPRLSPSNQRAYDLLRKAIGEAGETPPASNHIPNGIQAVREHLWRDYCYSGQVSNSDSPDAKQKAFKRAAETLVSKGLVGKWSEWVWQCQ